MKNLTVQKHTCVINKFFSVAMVGLFMIGSLAEAEPSSKKMEAKVKVSEKTAAAKLPKISRSFNPSSIATNEFTTLTIELINSSAEMISLKGAYSESLPNGMVILGSSSTTCGGLLKAEPGSSKVTLVDAKVPAYNACHILLGVTAAKAGVYEIKTSKHLAAAGAKLVVKKSAPMSLLVNKSYNPKKIKLNEFTTLSIALTNPNAEENMLTSSYNENLPEGMQILGASSTTCKGKLTAKPGSSKVVLSEAKIPAKSSCEILLGVTVKEKKSGVASELLLPDLSHAEQPTANMTGN